MKKNILYVDRYYFPDYPTMEAVPIKELHSNEGYQAFVNIKKSLAENNYVDTLIDLDEKVFDAISKQEKIGHSYDALITHIPYDPRLTRRDREEEPGISIAPYLSRGISYWKSLNLLERIKEAYQNILIIAYTGADPAVLSDENLKSRDVNHIVRKSADWKADLKNIEKYLD